MAFEQKLQQNSGKKVDINIPALLPLTSETTSEQLENSIVGNIVGEITEEVEDEIILRGAIQFLTNR